MFPAYADSKLAIMLFVNELTRRGIRAYVAESGRRGHGYHQGQQGSVGLVDRAQRASFSRAGPVRRSPVHPSGGDDRPAERHIRCAAALHAHRHPQGDESPQEGSRSGHGPSVMGTIRRVDGLRLDCAPHPIRNGPGGEQVVSVSDPVDMVEFDRFPTTSSTRRSTRIAACATKHRSTTTRSTASGRSHAMRTSSRR